MFLTLGCSCCCGRYVARYYLAVKDALVRESYRLGYLSKQRATQLVRVDVEKTGSVYDFCVSCGWVAAQN
jgi:transcriptional adapter 2-alpha